MAVYCYDGGECDGCMGCLMVQEVCRICGAPVGPDALTTENGPVCEDCRFEAAVADCDEETLLEYLAQDKEAFIHFVFCLR